MNYLAHLFFSDNQPEVMVGNFIADSVKGKKWANYPEKVQYGILMHRFIDHYTDEHLLTSETKKLLYPNCKKYAGAILDIILDHFIANDWQNIHSQELINYTNWCYQVFYDHYNLLPPKFQHMLPFMSQRNWLLNYGNLAGLQRSLTGLSKRIVNNPGIEHSVGVLEANFFSFSNHYKHFWPDLCSAVQNWKQENRR